MVNKIITLILGYALTAGTLSGQSDILPIDEKTGQITYSDVVQADDIGKDVLYARAKEWFALSFKSAQNVIQLDDNENGKLIGKASFGVDITTLAKVNAGYVLFTVEIQVKDGRYKYIFSDFWHEAGTSSVATPGDLRQEKPKGGLMTMGRKNWNSIKSQTNENALAMIRSLEETMTSTSDSDDDW